MERFMGWLRMNRGALVVATGMFAIMASVMAILLQSDFWGGVGDIFSDFEDTIRSPFLWAWRIGGAVTWPVFLWMLLVPFRNPNDPAAGGRLTATALVGAAYGGFGMLVTHVMDQVIFEALDSYGAGGGTEILLILMGMFVIDALSIAYTWGFCVIYATALQSLTGRQGRDWMLPSLGFTILGRWVGPAVISLLMGVVSSFIVFPLLVFDANSFLVYAIPIAIALSTGNFAGQWLAFWSAHDHVLGIVPPRLAPYGYPFQGQPIQMAPGVQAPVYPGTPAQPQVPYVRQDFMPMAQSTPYGAPGAPQQDAGQVGWQTPSGTYGLGTDGATPPHQD